jgi:hypothetical protein
MKLRDSSSALAATIRKFFRITTSPMRLAEKTNWALAIAMPVADDAVC